MNFMDGAMNFYKFFLYTQQAVDDKAWDLARENAIKDLLCFINIFCTQNEHQSLPNNRVENT